MPPVQRKHCLTDLFHQSMRFMLKRGSGKQAASMYPQHPNIDPKVNALVPVTLCHVYIPIALEMRAAFARRHGYPPRLRTARCGGDCYSFTLMPASLISFAHCGISDLILAAKSGGVLATISMPRSSRCLRASFCARTRAVSL